MSAPNIPEKVKPGRTRIGWIGTGIMGAPMAGHLLGAGYELRTFNRTETKAGPLLRRGATWCPSPEDVAAESDVVFLIVSYPTDVRRVLLGDGNTDDGVFAHLRPGAIVVDMTTSSPTLARELAQTAAGRGIDFLDAPVSGGDLGARHGTLSIMVGGSHDALERIRPVLELMGKTIVHHGGSGSGQDAKMVNQILIAGNMIGLCEALLYAAKAGLDPEKMLTSVSTGAAGSWSLSHLAPRILRGDFAPGFLVEHFLKDMGIVLAEADRMGLALPGLALIRQLYTVVAANGMARDGTQSLWKALRILNGMDPNTAFSAETAV